MPCFRISLKMPTNEINISPYSPRLRLVGHAVFVPRAYCTVVSNTNRHPPLSVPIVNPTQLHDPIFGLDAREGRRKNGGNGKNGEDGEDGEYGGDVKKGRWW